MVPWLPDTPWQAFMYLKSSLLHRFNRHTSFFYSSQKSDKMLRMPSSQWHSICTTKHHYLVSQEEPISSVSESRLHRCTHTARVYQASWSRKAGDAEEAELPTVIQECLQAKTRGYCHLRDHSNELKCYQGAVAHNHIVAR
jgi:hypothetical protein